ncbi:MAG TPA: hypothetical protein VMU53_11870 [Candidatus Sulfotelmatobacter sp.]|nr:hypothetical protein [Candidatus Sulfotelmatobacter sp.]
MPELISLPAFPRFRFMRDVAIRTGVYAGVSLSMVFAAWILIANRVPFLDPIAMERNIIASALLAVLACIPLFRFYRSPAHLLVSGLLAWTLLTFTYRVFCFKFVLLEEYYSAFHVFVLGAVSYLIFATISWIGTIIWRVHATDSSHTHH